MDLLEKIPSLIRKWFAKIFLLALTLVAVVPAQGYAPTLLLGLYGQELFTGDQGSHSGVRASGLVSWRTLIAENASLALYARSIADLSPLKGAQLYDSHTLSVEALLRGEAGRIFLEGGLSGSWSGTLEGQFPYLRPDWRIGYEHGWGDVHSSISCAGYYLYQPEGSEDALFQGLTLGLAVDPSIRLRWGLEILGGWEIWTEQERNDLLGSVKTSTGGLIGYFIDWSIAAEGGVRWSEVEEQSNLFFTVDTDWAWSPHRQVSLELGAFAREEIELWSDGIPGVFTAGVDFRGDWTPNDRLYLVTEVTGSRSFADVATESGWSLTARAGVELGF